MYRHGVSQFEQELVTIHPGEYFATRDDAIVSTILGSCVAVGLYDEEARIGGLNHFMLPHRAARGGDAAGMAGGPATQAPDAKYGENAMRLLLDDLSKLGARLGALKAKVFGGGSVLGVYSGEASRIPVGNVEFAFEYLREEGIPVVASDVGGKEPRKIFFYARTGKVLLKRIASGVLADLAGKDEERYIRSLDGGQ